MRMRRWVLALLLGTVVLPTSSPPGHAAPDDAVPLATQVVVRGKKAFADALAAAVHPATVASPARPVLLVFDVTPYTRRGRAAIEAALASQAPEVASWSIAALGEKPSKPASSASQVGAHLAEILREDTNVVSTLTALEKTIKGWREKEGVVVYVADWHFEDDVDLEGFIRDLQKKGRTLSVVGTEAAFGRGWNDGLRDLTESFESDLRGTRFEDYWEGVGRDPFGGRSKKAPWHGGDTAYPYAPYRWDDQRWETAFSLSDWDMADLDEGLGGLLDGLGGLTEGTERLQEITEELERIDEQLLDPTLDDETRRELEARRQALEEEAEEVLNDALEGMGGKFAEDAKRARRLAKLEEQRRDVVDRLGTLMVRIAGADDPAEERRLEAEYAKLEAERDRLTGEIDRLEAEIAAPEADEPPPGLPFPPEGDVPDPEELKGRLPPGVVPDDTERPDFIDPTDVHRIFPLPSSFGPYGLMRAAGVTGGRYVLFSWNPSGRKTVVYEYSRCNLFPPDLRPRKEILHGLRENPWARPVLEAWWTLVKARADVLEQLPPVKENLRSAASMDRLQERDFLMHSWDSPGDQKALLRSAARAVEALDRALVILDEGLDAAGEPKTPVAQRYHAEALLFRHAARVARFELLETIAVAQEVPRSAFRKKGEKPGVSDEPWVRQGRDPKRVRTWDQVKPRDIDAAMELVAERKALLERFRGTPFGEQVAMNTIDTARPVAWEVTDTLPDTGRSPSESTDTPKPTPPPPGGSSGPGGPTTGK